MLADAIMQSNALRKGGFNHTSDETIFCEYANVFDNKHIAYLT